MKHPALIRFIRPAALALLVGLVLVLGLGGTAQAWIGEAPSLMPEQIPPGTVPAREADLAITKTGGWVVSTDTADSDQIVYTLRVVNNGRAVARNVMVNDPLPAGVTFDSTTITIIDPPRTITQERCLLRDDVVLCTLGNLAAGQVGLIELRVQVSSRRTTTVQNMAIVTSRTFDPLPLNNFAELTLNRP